MNFNHFDYFLVCFQIFVNLLPFSLDVRAKLANELSISLYNPQEQQLNGFVVHSLLFFFSLFLFFLDTVLNFIRNHPLMDEAVSHENGAPVFYKGDVSFSSLVVERLTVQGFTDDKHYTVYYAGTGMDHIVKNLKSAFKIFCKLKY